MFGFNHIRRAFRASRYGKLALVVLFAGLVLAAVSAVNLQAAAPAGAVGGTDEQVIDGVEERLGDRTSDLQTQTGAVICPVPSTDAEINQLKQQYLKWTYNVLSGHATVTNNHPTCAYEFGFKSFKILSATETTPQSLYDKDIKIVWPGQTASFDIDLPTCRYQSDLIIGPNLKWTPAKNLAGAVNLNLPVCEQPLKVSCAASPNPAKTDQTVTWTAAPTGGSGTYKYKWVGDGAFPDGATTKSVTAKYGGSGTKKATVTVTTPQQSVSATCSVVINEVTSDPTCSKAIQYGFIVVSGGTAKVTITNPNAVGASNCDKPFGLASYKVYSDHGSDEFLSTQKLFDNDSAIVSPGQTKTLNVNLPSCNYQVDFFRGTQPKVPPFYGSELISWIQNQSLGLCTDVVPPPPVCSPSSQSAFINENVNFSATGGDGSFAWTGGGSPATGDGSNFTTKFATGGTKTVTVTSHGRSDTCEVVVSPAPADLICTPTSQSVNVNDIASFSAAGGSGALTWSANGGSPSSGSGSTFQSSWGTAGFKAATVTDTAGHSATCSVQVNSVSNPTAPVCSPSSQNADVDENVNFTATGGNGTFSWTAGGGSPSSGSGSSFDTNFDDDGTFVVVVTSNGLSDTCTVFVDEDDDDDLDCSPSDQDAETGDLVTFRASGGSGDYEWEADEGDADPDDGDGRTFTTEFDDEGTHTVRVRDDEGHTATCEVDVEDDADRDDLSCSPSSQTVRVNEIAEFVANDGTGDYEWDAGRDASDRFGFGRRFETSFDEPGTYDVELESNGEDDTCRVRVVEDDDDAPFCSPAVQSASVNDFVTFSATGGNGSYSWSTSGDGSPSAGSGSSFGTRFLTSGNKLVLVTSNGRTSQCLVQIGSVLGASTVVTGPTETAAAAAGLGLLGALGAYGAVYRERSKKFLSKIARIVRR